MPHGGHHASRLRKRINSKAHLIENGYFIPDRRSDLREAGAVVEPKAQRLFDRHRNCQSHFRRHHYQVNFVAQTKRAGAAAA